MKKIFLSFVQKNRFSEASNIYFSARLKKTSVTVLIGDITEETTDAIVNSANSDLLHVGGLAGAISAKGGDAIKKECNVYVRLFGKVETGQVALTGAGNLKCEYLIHAIGPIWKGGNSNEEEKLKSCVLNCIKKADTYDIKSIAIPAISTGIYGFPKELAAKIFAKTIYDCILESNNSFSLKEIRLIDRSDVMINLWTKELKNYFKEEQV